MVDTGYPFGIKCQYFDDVVSERMSETTAMVGGLKRILKARRINYSNVSDALGLSEATVKRMFSKNDFSLRRFEQVCELADVSMAELAREVDSEQNYISELSEDQERRIVGNTKLFLVAVCVLNHLSLEQIVSVYELSESECIQLLLVLGAKPSGHISSIFPRCRAILLCWASFESRFPVMPIRGIANWASSAMSRTISSLSPL